MQNHIMSGIVPKGNARTIVPDVSDGDALNFWSQFMPNVECDPIFPEQLLRVDHMGQLIPENSRDDMILVQEDITRVSDAAVGSDLQQVTGLSREDRDDIRASSEALEEARIHGTISHEDLLEELDL